MPSMRLPGFSWKPAFILTVTDCDIIVHLLYERVTFLVLRQARSRCKYLQTISNKKEGHPG